MESDNMRIPQVKDPELFCLSLPIEREFPFRNFSIFTPTPFGMGISSQDRISYEQFPSCTPRI